MKMKYIATIISLVTVMSVVASYGQNVTSFRWINVNPGSLTDNDGVDIPSQEATILTFLTPDDTFNPITAMDPNAFDSWAEVDAAFDFYRAMPNPGAGSFSTAFMNEDLPNDFAVGQYAWALALDLPFASFTTVAALPNTVYFGLGTDNGNALSAQIPSRDSSPVPPATSFSGFSTQTMQQIPEPSVFALMGLGGLLVMIRRRFVVKS